MSVDDEAIGFRPLLTRAAMSDSLEAAPSEYDAAPTYLSRAYAEQSEAVKREVAMRAAEAVAAPAIGNTLGRQARIALELVAPVGFGAVRSVALAGQLAHVVVAFNPVVAVLTVPALLFTAEATVKSLRRAFGTDPKVRTLIDRASAAQSVGDHRGAEQLLKEALELELDPTYRRNGDLWMQLGLVQMTDGRPRQAMVSLARASVLFGPEEVFAVTREGRTTQVSKRGFAELMACAAVDSFARSADGLDEWQAILEDFASSAQKRFETVAALKEEGHVLGLFGIDQASASFGRELAAKVRFFVAKMRLRASGTDREGQAQFEGALRELDAAELTPDERVGALLEQAQFYAQIATEGGCNIEHAKRVLALMERAETILEPSAPAGAARLRAEAAAFGLQVMPRLVARQQDVTALRDTTDRLLKKLQRLGGAQAGLALAGVARGWAAEQRFQLAATIEARSRAITDAHRAYLEAGEHVAAMFAAVRLAYLTNDPAEMKRAVRLVTEAAESTLRGDTDPVSRAFAGRYLIESAPLAGVEARPWGEVAAAFEAAAKQVQVTRTLTAFTLHGKPIVHPWPVAQSILFGQAALAWARAGDGARAIVAQERASTVADQAEESVKARVALDGAALLLELGHLGPARDLADESERLAKAMGDPLLHRRSLELRERIRTGADKANQPEASQSESVQSPLLGWAEDELLGSFAARRAELVEAGNAILEILSDPALKEAARDLRERATIERIQQRLDRVAAGRFRVGIVGEFSSGKSTFLNALLGEAILPSSIRPTTSAPNRIAWGEQKAIRVSFHDGHQETASLADLPAFTTEKGNPKNQRGVAQIEIAYPLPLLKRGVELLDTPGVGSLFEAHTRLTYELLPTCDALILLATARQPYTESIGKFLSALREAVAGKVFYVLNKMDQVEPDNRRASVEFAATRVAESVQGARVFPTSAYRALVGRRLRAGTLDAAELDDDPRAGDERDPSKLIDESGMPRLERELGKFLVETRGDALLADAASDIRDALRLVEQQILARKKASQLSAQARLDTHRQFSRDLAQRQAAIAKAHERFDAALARVLAELRGKIEREIPRMHGSLIDAVCIQENDLQTEQARAGLQQRLKDVTRDRTREWIAATVDQAAREVSATIEEARLELQRHRRELRTEFGSVLGERVDGHLVDDALPSFDVQIDTNLAGNLAVSALVGFLGGLFLGVFGVFLAPLVGPWLTQALQGGAEAQIAVVRSKMQAGLAPALAELAPRLSAEVDKRFGEAVRTWRARIVEEREQVTAEFEAQLATLVGEQEEVDAIAHEATRQLDQLQRRARTARGVLDVLAKGES